MRLLAVGAMEINQIQSTAIQTLYGSQSKANGRQATGQTNTQEPQTQGNDAQTQADNLEQTARQARINPELANGYHGLSLKQARRTLGEVSAQIGRSNPWKLVDIQAVTESNLLGGRYY